MTGFAILPRNGGAVLGHAVDAEHDLHLRDFGIPVNVGGALLDRAGDDRVDELDRGRGFRGLAELELGLDFLLGLGDVLDRGIEIGQAIDEREDVGLGGHGGTNLEPGDHRDLVDRHDVRRIGHRDDQRAVRHEPDGNRAVAADVLRQQQVDGTHVDLEDRQVDVVDPESLAERAGKLGLRDHA